MACSLSASAGTPPTSRCSASPVPWWPAEPGPGGRHRAGAAGRRPPGRPVRPGPALPEPDRRGPGQGRNEREHVVRTRIVPDRRGALGGGRPRARRGLRRGPARRHRGDRGRALTRLAGGDRGRSLAPMQPVRGKRAPGSLARLVGAAVFTIRHRCHPAARAQAWMPRLCCSAAWLPWSRADGACSDPGSRAAALPAGSRDRCHAVPPPRRLVDTAWTPQACHSSCMAGAVHAV